MKKRLLSLLCVAAMICCMVPTAFAASSEAVEAANDLNALGLFSGVGTNADGTPNYDLDRTPTRHEAITMLVGLLGKSEEARQGTWEIPFTDVADWAKPYVGYAYTNGLTSGTSATTYGGDLPVTAGQYLTFVLKALGYDSTTDFQWDKAWELTDRLELTDGRYNAGTTTFTRGDVVIISTNTLLTEMKTENRTLLKSLMKNDVVPSNADKILKPHEWDKGTIKVAPICGKEGIKLYTCKECGITKTESVPALNHNYQVSATVDATCTAGGSTVYTCSNCAHSYTNTSPALGHALNASNTCTRCGVFIVPTLNMTDAEKRAAGAVGYISDRDLDYNEAGGYFDLTYSLKDDNKNYMSAPGLIDIKIVNDAGETVYKTTKLVKTSDFRSLTPSYGGAAFLGNKIRISNSEITKGNSDYGTLTFTLYNQGYYSFSEYSFRIIGDLPEIDLADACDLELPDTPQTIKYYGYDNRVRSSVKITDITYKFEGSYDNDVKLQIYFTGEKLFDEDGRGQSSSCKIGWKLYDDNGYVVETGTHYTSSLAMGEKFRNSEENIYDLAPGNYVLELINVN